MANSVVDAIRQVAAGDPHVMAAMLMGSSMESNWNPNAVGDNGKSFGPFQIYTVAHPSVSPAQAKDPLWSAQYMLGAYQAGVAKVSPALWQSDPATAAATAAYYAERPKVMYQGYQSHWSQVQAALNGADISGPVTGASGGGGVVQAFDPLGLGGAASQITTSFTHGILTLANMALFFAAAWLGFMLFGIGVMFVFWSTPTGQKAVAKTAQVAGAAIAFIPGGQVAGAAIRAKGTAHKLDTVRQGQETRKAERVQREEKQRVSAEKQRAAAVKMERQTQKDLAKGGNHG